MPIVFRDYFEFPFNEGRGIKGSQIALDIGLPDYYLGTLVHDDVAHTLTGDVSGVDDADVSLLAFFFLTIPLVLPRTADSLSIVIAGRMTSLGTTVGGAVAARDLTPGELLEVLRTTGAATRVRLVTTLNPRPQDWDAVLAWTDPTAADFVLRDADVAAGEVFTTPDITVQDAPTGATRRNSILYIGVPEDARQIEAVTIPETGNVPTIAFNPQPGTTVEVNNVPFQWYTWGIDPRTADRTYRLRYGGYNP